MIEDMADTLKSFYSSRYYLLQYSMMLFTEQICIIGINISIVAMLLDNI